VVGSKWVFVVKWNEKGKIEKRKAKTVAKGYTQVIREDYDETYASVAKLESVRLVCAIAASRQLLLWQIDFILAFLNSKMCLTYTWSSLEVLRKGEKTMSGN